MKSLERLISCVVTELSDHASQGAISSPRGEIREAALYGQHLYSKGEINRDILDEFLLRIGYTRS
jgi:hypothetical protein